MKFEDQNCFALVSRKETLYDIRDLFQQPARPKLFAVFITENDRSPKGPLCIITT